MTEEPTYRPLSEEEKVKVAAEARQADAQTKKIEAELAMNIAKNEAEIAKSLSLARKYEAEASTAEYQSAEAAIELARVNYKREKELALDEFHKIYRFHGVVKDDSVK